ncbi:MAG: hypothetical protein ACD_3C00086G0005 [uncultured bacterium (gcode 4)]|uniref:DNA-binding protein HU n=1 Tax=uncultured bacterium (gcode 4) TaxID=1234023 RepID=K2FAN8_9BACT|nr:MAG: hypothetical protein ACD_3C00086G0005 [uncultured bacterium (gcode 4)]
MKKLDFIKALANQLSMGQDVTGKFLDGAISLISSELKKGEEINITWFGVFKVSNRAARNGINPKTKEAIKIPASKSPAFKAWKTFKEAIK